MNSPENPAEHLAHEGEYDNLRPEAASEHALSIEQAQQARCSVAVGSASGPSYCKLCGEWPARQTPKGLRCHLCECRDICADNPVPLPNGRECLQDLASIGVPGAAEKLALLPNNPDLPTR